MPSGEPFILLDDARRCEIARVWKHGLAVEDLTIASSGRTTFANTVRAEIPQEEDLRGPEGAVHVIGVQRGKILTDHLVENSSASGISHLSVLERHGRGSKPANGFVKGFGALKGAIASSVGHDSHNLIVVGSHPRDMKAALQSLIECGGGFSVVKGGEVLARLPLPFGGLMSGAGAKNIAGSLRNLHRASMAIGCILPEPFLQLAFLSLPVIPSLKLTDKGLVDVNKFQIIDVRAS